MYKEKTTNVSMDSLADELRLYHTSTIELDLDRNEHSRSVYTWVDFFGDVGGFLSILQLFGQLLFLFLPFLAGTGSLSTYMINQLF